MACGLEAVDCVICHWMPVLGGRREPAGWRAPCPLCSTPRALSVEATGKRPKWNTFCPCERPEVRAKLAQILPDCVPALHSPRPAVDRDELIALALDKSLPPNALRVALLQSLGMTTPEIRAKLAIPKQSWSDVVRILGQNRRSA